MKYICGFCGTEFFSAAENLDGTKCWNCKKGRIANAEIKEIDMFLAELDADLAEMEIDLGLEPGDLTNKPPHAPLFHEFVAMHEKNEGLASGMKELAEKTGAELRARLFGGIERKPGEYCRNCVYLQPKWRLEGKVHYSEGSCTIDNWQRKCAFEWCKHFSPRKKR